MFGYFKRLKKYYNIFRKYHWKLKLYIDLCDHDALNIEARNVIVAVQQALAQLIKDARHSHVSRRANSYQETHNRVTSTALVL